MNTPFDPLDDLLKADAAAMQQQYIDDAGFTTRVIDGLPARRRLSRKLRIGLPLAFTAVAGTIVMCCTGADNLAIDAFMDLATETITANVLGLALVIAVAIGVSASSITGKG